MLFATLEPWHLDCAIESEVFTRRKVESKLMFTNASNKFCRSVGVDYPIIQAPMAGGLTSAELVTAVSNAGGLGCIASGYLGPEALRTLIRTVKHNTSKPFCVNLFARTTEPYRAIGPAAEEMLRSIASELSIPAPDFGGVVADDLDQLLEVVCEEKPSIISTTFGSLEPEWISRIQAYGGRLVGTATSVAEAVELEKAGCFAVVAQGIEAGGHRGSFLYSSDLPSVGLFSLVPLIVDAVRIPVIASGGIMDGRAIVAALALGSVAVQMGSAFLTTHESAASDVWKSALSRAADTSTVLTRAFSGKYARGLENRFIQRMQPLEKEFASYPAHNKLTGSIRAEAKRCGAEDYMSLWAGQSAGLARSISAAELVSELVKEVERTCERLFSTENV